MSAHDTYIKWLHKLYQAGVPLPDRDIVTLKQANLIKESVVRPIDQELIDFAETKINRRDFSVRHPLEQEALHQYDTLEIDEDIHKTIFSDKEYKQIRFKKKYDKVIKQDWLPYDAVQHTKEFYLWIDSINAGFQTRTNYSKFNKYVQQAEDWMAENKDSEDIDESSRFEYQVNEIKRIAQNTLYFCLKYGWLQESSLPEGRRKYKAGDDYEHHKIILYLLDCGYSFVLGKPRQIGSTSVLGLAAVCRSLTRPNHYLKFITEDEKTGIEIFNDKISFALSQLPEWMTTYYFKGEFKSIVINEREKLLRLGKKTYKGGDKGLNSRVEIVAPSRTAINGGSPSLVFLDEIGSIPILTEMINEGRPTMFMKDMTTGKLIMRRQIVLWGTGTTGRGGGSYETEWKKIKGLWDEREFGGGIVPLFFDWTTRCSEEEYMQEKKFYYGTRAKKENIDVEISKIQFHQHYPSSPTDMFTTTSKTLMSRDYIEANITRIKKVFKNYDQTQEGIAPVQHGYFEPEYNLNKPLGENSDIPYEIVGANWIPCDVEDERWTSVIFQHPRKNWVDRYYQGTDPISADTGSSKMASAIWDKHYNTVSAIVNHREPNNPAYSFLQCLLMNLYYGNIPELIERNIGLSYKQYKENKGYYRQFVVDSELPPSLRTGNGTQVGLDNKGGRARVIIGYMYEVYETFGEKIFIQEAFDQLKTFICKLSKDGKHETWQTQDTRYYDDDVLFAIVFSYLCSISCNRNPYDKETENTVKVPITKSKYDSNWNLTLVTEMK